MPCIGTHLGSPTERGAVKRAALQTDPALDVPTFRGAAEALTDLADLPLNRYPHLPLLARVWQLRHNVTAYDAVYLALAEALRAPLLTRDARLASAPGHRARVALV